MSESSPIEADLRERQRELEILVTSAGWEIFLQQLASRIMQLDSAALNFELNADYRSHLNSQRAMLLEILRWVYHEAQVAHPFDEQLCALYGRIERKLRTPQPQVQAPPGTIGQGRPNNRWRRGAGSIA